MGGKIIKTACGHFAVYPIISFLAVSAAYGQVTNRAQDARLAYAHWKCAAYSIFSGNSEYESNHFFERGYGYYVKATTSESDEPAELELRKILPSFFIHGHRLDSSFKCNG